MTPIPILREDDPATPPDARAYLQEARQSRGHLINIYRAMANTVYRGTSTLDPKDGDLAYLTATVVNNCYY